MNQPKSAARIPNEWGWCFKGNETTYCKHLLDSAQSGKIQYAEIGIGHGVTLKSVANFLEESGIDFKIHGVDIPGLLGPATNPETYAPHQVLMDLEPQEAWALPSRSIGVYLCSSEVWLMEQDALDYVFIDGCHGYDCAKRDFLQASDLVRPGGIICFHDTSQNCQGRHMQPHCGTGIDVRRAVEDLGLLNGTAKGWEKVDETHGNDATDCHGCLWVRKLDH